MSTDKTKMEEIQLDEMPTIDPISQERMARRHLLEKMKRAELLLRQIELLSK